MGLRVLGVENQKNFGLRLCGKSELKAVNGREGQGVRGVGFRV